MLHADTAATTMLTRCSCRRVTHALQCTETSAPAATRHAQAWLTVPVVTKDGIMLAVSEQCHSISVALVLGHALTSTTVVLH